VILDVLEPNCLDDMSEMPDHQRFIDDAYSFANESTYLDPNVTDRMLNAVDNLSFMLHVRRNACRQNFTQMSGYQSLQSSAGDVNAVTAQSSSGNTYENSNTFASEPLGLSVYQPIPDTHPLSLQLHATGYNQDSLTQSSSSSNFI